jgi:hypothetical protein
VTSALRGQRVAPRSYSAWISAAIGGFAAASFPQGEISWS